MKVAVDAGLYRSRARASQIAHCTDDARALAQKLLCPFVVLVALPGLELSANRSAPESSAAAAGAWASSARVRWSKIQAPAFAPEVASRRLRCYPRRHRPALGRDAAT
jgi:hypothetical protein